MNILYVEDNPLDRGLVERYIRTTSHQLKMLPKPQAVGSDEFEVDLILLDIYFGGKVSGLDYLKQIREMGIQCPVAAVTALALPHQLEQYQNAGIEWVIKKPFEITELAELISYFDR